MNTTPPKLLSCGVCGAASIEIIQAFASLPRATSDCRPFPPGGSLGICKVCHTVQKPASPQWEADATAIYSRYDIFRQAAGGAEQRVFDQASGESLRRSDKVLKRLQAAYPFATKGRALDVGCGNGPTLQALSELAPGWELFGHEISDTNAARLGKIPGFQKLYTGDPADIEGPFDLITLFHSLEHLPDPVGGLKGLRGKLAPGGVLLVEVPNVRTNIYDLVVADHRSHFDPGTLATAGKNAGWPHVMVFDDWAFKELTMLVAEAPLPASLKPAVAVGWQPSDVQQRIDWLSALVQTATDVAKQSKSFGLFGTAIAGTWMFGPLADRVAFFVDEDPARIGQQHEGRPIVGPDQVPADATVFVPLLPEIAKSVAERLARHGVDARLPPALNLSSSH